MKRFPVIATVLTVLACATMIGLGVWQLRRADEKAALLVRYVAASKLPEMAWPAVPLPDGEGLFRKAAGYCLEPVSLSVAPGANRAGRAGWRHIAQCRTGAEGPGMRVDLGWSADFKAKPDWRGGRVAGVIGLMPKSQSVIGRMFGQAEPDEWVLVSDVAAKGLVASAPPSLDDVPNNHFGYAVQWFLFAGIAAVIYLIALRRRARA